MPQFKPLAFAAALAFIVGCDQAPMSPDANDVVGPDDSPVRMISSANDVLRTTLLDEIEPASSPEEALDMINERLTAAGMSVAVAKMEYVTGGPQADRAGQTVFATDRQLRLPYRWVAGDTRRNANGDLITQVTFAPFATANAGTPAAVDGLPPIDASFDTWNAVTCSNLNILDLPSTFANPSAILGGDPFLADISTMGFLPGAFFDLLAPDGSTFILGVTFTFIFLDPATGEPTDVNNDGRLDTALKEVWYNDAFTWSTDGSPGTFDIETVALHENGHALELGHFGRVFITNRNGKLHVSPRAVMNAFILGTLRTPLGTDNSSYCGNFANWPT